MTAMLPNSPATLLERLDAGDRALFARWLIGDSSSPTARTFWRALTHLGGAWCAIAAAVVPLLVGHATHDIRLRHLAAQALAALVLSHLVVQVIKRTVGRPRPVPGTPCGALINVPDRFSFPSGHATAAMSVAFVYAAALPPLAAPLLAIAVAVGFSRVCLGVHYPGDVLAGQAIAVATGLALMAR